MEKKNTGLIIFLILIILGLGGYLVYDKVLSKGKQKEEDKLEATMTKEEAETLLDKYFSGKVLEQGYTDLVKTEVAIENTKAESFDCSVIDYNSGKYHMFYTCDNNKAKFYSFENVADTFKKMFKTGSIFKDNSEEGQYALSDLTLLENGYLEPGGDAQFGGAYPMILPESYKNINTVTNEENIARINISVGVIEWRLTDTQEFEFYVHNYSTGAIDVDEKGLDANGHDLSYYNDLLPQYEFIFEKTEDGYIFLDFNRVK